MGGFVHIPTGISISVSSPGIEDINLHIILASSISQ